MTPVFTRHPFVIVLTLVSAVALSRAVGAGVSFDFLFHAESATSDDQVFLNVAVQHYGYGRADLEPVLPGSGRSSWTFRSSSSWPRSPTDPSVRLSTSVREGFRGTTSS